MKIRNLFCLNLRQLIKEKGFTLESFAEHYGSSDKYIHKIVYGGMWPSDKTIGKLAKKLGVKESDFFRVQPAKRPNPKPKSTKL